jgi:hypothetical protein
MSVRGVGGRGKSSGAGKAGGPAGVSKANGAFGSKADKAESLVGASGLVQSSNVGAAAPADPVAAQVMDLARRLKSGELKSRDEATKKLVTDILRDRVRMQSKRLTDKVLEKLKDDPRLHQTLERLWTRAESEQE